MYLCFLSLAHSAKACSRKPFTNTLSRFSSTIPLFADSPQVTPLLDDSLQSSPQRHLYERRYSELRDSLTYGASPSRVWAHYTNLIDILGYEKLPLQLHQEVLRRCTPPSNALRVSAARRLAAGNKPSNPHIHEDRFQLIIRNIAAMDLQPDIDDYHFILEQFAAVGHYVGAIQVYKEMIHIGITPRTKTFGLCLQAIAHRLTLPIDERARNHRSNRIRRIMADLITDMQKLRIPFTSANLDLTIRIMKETIDAETFENIMKWGYGIDLSNPDRPPLEFSNPPASGMAKDFLSTLPRPQAFSTAALNTTLEILGRFGDISKLVQAFEVLTQPLPRPNDHLFSSFDDDDDIGIADVPLIDTLLPPSTAPNTTSYNTLIRYLAKAGEMNLVRHYINQAILLELQTDQKLRANIKSTRETRKVLKNKTGFESVPAPHFAINRATFMPVFSECNRNKNYNMMRWLYRKTNKIMRRKKECLSYFSVFRDRMSGRREKERKRRLRRQLVEEARAKRRAAASAAAAGAQSAPAETESNSAFVPPAQPHERHPSLLSRESLPRVPKQRVSVFDVDLDAPPSFKSPSNEPANPFAIDLHIRILERDIMEIEAFQKHLEYIIGRTHQRIKERLGRRVWAGKDIFLTTAKTRQIISKEEWRRIVNFKPRKPDHPGPPASSRRSGRQDFPSTFFQSNQAVTQESAEPSTPSSLAPTSSPLRSS